MSVKLRNSNIDSLKIKPLQNNYISFLENVQFHANTPFDEIDTTKISLINKDSIKVDFEISLDTIKNTYSFSFEKLEEEDYNFQFLPGSFTDLYNTTNDTLKVANPYSQKDMYAIAIEGYKNLSNDFPQLNYEYPSVKSSLISFLQTYNHTSGYLNPLTGEAQVNDKIPKTSYPTTTCHEMAHQIGFAAENEANFIGFLAANYNDDPYFKYASYRMAFGYCISELRKRDANLSKKLWERVNYGIVKDFKESYDFWQRYKNPFVGYKPILIIAHIFVWIRNPLFRRVCR